jgi:hypothetical protein
VREEQVWTNPTVQKTRNLNRTTGEEEQLLSDTRATEAGKETK